MDRVRLKCKTCGQYHDINKTTPVEFENWAYSGFEWSDFKDSVPPLSEEVWSKATCKKQGEYLFSVICHWF